MHERSPSGESKKEKHAQIGSSSRFANSAILERCWKCNLFSHKCLAAANFCSGSVVVWMVSVLNRQLDIYIPSRLTSKLLSLCSIYAPIPDSFLEKTNSASPILIFAIFWTAGLAFSLSLTAWFFTNASAGRRQPNKILGLILVFGASLLEIWLGVTVEEFCLLAMPITTSICLILGSVL